MGTADGQVSLGLGWRRRRSELAGLDGLGGVGEGFLQVLEGRVVLRPDGRYRSYFLHRAGSATCRLLDEPMAERVHGLAWPMRRTHGGGAKPSLVVRTPAPYRGSMTSVAFLGLGRMGALMAQRLLEAGHELTVWNRTLGKADALVAGGAREAATPAAAVADADVVVTMLSDPHAVREVLLGADGAGPALRPGALVVEMSTIGPAAVAELRAELPEQARLVDAPVQGSLPQAGAGKLNIFLGAADEDAVAAKEILERLGTVKHVGAPGAGAALKIVVNGMTVSAFAAMGEALRLADRLGVDADDALDALSGTAVGPLATRVKQRLAEPDAPTQFGLGLAEKDLRLALEAGAVTDGITAAAQRALAAAVADGLAESDVSRVVRHIRG